MRDRVGKTRYLTVPMNGQGIYDYEYGVVGSKNCIEYYLPPEEFEMLYNTVFPAINDRCHLLIDDYESEEIMSQNVKKCMDIIEPVEGIFREACMQALEYDTFVGMDF